MDKNKNRTDLLAAGRKKLQQYRKKKDKKGSNISHGKSSDKSSKNNNDGDPEEPSKMSEPIPSIDTDGPSADQFNPSIISASLPVVEDTRNQEELPIVVDRQDADDLESQECNGERLENKKDQIGEIINDMASTSENKTAYLIKSPSLCGNAQILSEVHERESGGTIEETTTLVKEDNPYDKPEEKTHIEKIIEEPPSTIDVLSGNVEVGDSIAVDVDGNIQNNEDSNSTSLISSESERIQEGSETISLAEDSENTGETTLQEEKFAGPQSYHKNEEEREIDVNAIFHLRGREEDNKEHVEQCRNQEAMISVPSKMLEEASSIEENTETNAPTEDILATKGEDIAVIADTEIHSIMPMEKNNDDRVCDSNSEVENFRQLVYVISIEKDILKLQLDEQIAINVENKQLSSEVSKLRNLLKESQDSNVTVNKELEDCRSELKIIAITKDEVETRCLSTKNEMEELQIRATELQDKIEQSQEGLSRVLAEFADCRVSLETLQKENLELAQSVIFEQNATKRLMEEKNFFSSENIKLASEVADQKEQLILALDKHLELMKSFDQLAEDNVYLANSLLVHEEKIKELNERQLEVPSALNELKNREHGSSVLYNVLKQHLDEANVLLYNLEKTVDGMYSQTVSLIRSSGRVAAPGISKIIQAFESKAHHLENISDETPLLIEGHTEDSYALTKEQTCSLRNILNRIDLELGKSYIHSWSQSKIQNGPNNLFQERIDGLVEKLSGYKFRIVDLQNHIGDMQQNANEETTRLFNQIALLQNEANKASIFKQENDILNGVLSDAIKKLNASLGLQIDDEFDVSSHIMASVDAVVFEIKTLNEKLELDNCKYNTLQSAFEELNKSCAHMQEKNGLIFELLKKVSNSFQESAYDSYEGKALIDATIDELLQLIPTKLQKIIDEHNLLKSTKNELEAALSNRNNEIQELNLKYDALSKKFDEECRTKEDLESILTAKGQIFEQANNIILSLAKKIESDDFFKDFDGVFMFTKSDEMENGLYISTLLRLEVLVSYLLEKHKEVIEQINSSKICLQEANVITKDAVDNMPLSLHSLLRQEFLPMVYSLKESLQLSRASNHQQESEIQILKEHVSKIEESLEASSSELNLKVAELEQSEQRLSSVREKLSIAVAKGKGLIVQRDSLKQSLMKKSSELENCLQDLRSMETLLHETEAKLKSCSEVDRVEALESELSYIRDSATALRDSFLLKDSVLQRIEEVLEDLDLPEHFHSKDIVEKIELLSRLVTGNSSLSMTDFDQKDSEGVVVIDDSWKDETQTSSNQGSDDLKRKYEELQSKYYCLAEHNDILEQSLHERNNLIQRWEEKLDRIDMPSHLRTLEPDDRIESLGRELSEIQHERDALHLKIENLEVSSDMLIVDLEESHKKISELSAEVVNVKSEKDFFSESLDKLRFQYLALSEKAVHDEVERENLQRELADLQEKMPEKVQGKGHHGAENEMQKLHDLILTALPGIDKSETISDVSAVASLEALVRRLIDNYMIPSSEKPDYIPALNEAPTDETNQLARGINDKNQVLLTLTSKLDKAFQNINCLKEERDATMDKCHYLTSQIEEITQKMNSLQEERTYDLEKCRSLMLEIEEITKKMNFLQEERIHDLEKYQSLALELEAESKRKDALQEQLTQEEQKSASAREKLNVAVRKGKGLVQQRDALKQTIEEMNTMLEHLKTEYNQRVETLESEKSSLMNQLQENSQYLSSLLTAIQYIDIDSEVNAIDPIQKIEEIGKVIRYLHSALVSSQNEANKSKQANELLLIELNEVQDRVDVLQENLGKLEADLDGSYKEKHEAVAAKFDADLRLEQFMSIHSEERKREVEKLVELNSSIDRLRKRYIDFSSLLYGILRKDADLVSHVQSFLISFMKQMNGESVSDLLLHGSSNLLHANPIIKEDFNAHNVHSNFGENSIAEQLACTCNDVYECIKEYDDLQEKLHQYISSIQQQETLLSETIESVKRNFDSQKGYSELLKQEVTGLKLAIKEKDIEISSMHDIASLLYEACRCSVTEIENRKTQHVSERSSRVMTLPCFNDVKDRADMEYSIQALADSLLSMVRSSDDVTELKANISELHRELQEKEIEMKRVSEELISQLREAEAGASRSLIDLNSSKKQVDSLEKKLIEMENDKKLLGSRISELEECEASSQALQDRLKSLSDLLAAKDQEIESLKCGLIQALDEEESKMEALENRNIELEDILQEKIQELQNLEASRAKALAKFSTTVSKFDELHNLSENLLQEVENLESQLKERDSEISFLRQEVTRCTNNDLASQETNKKYLSEINKVLKWLEMLISRIGETHIQPNDENCSKIHAYVDILDKKIASVMNELEDLRLSAQSKDSLLQIERGRVEELLRNTENIDTLHDKEIHQRDSYQGERDSVNASSSNSPGHVEIEQMVQRNKASVAPVVTHIRSGRKVNNDQIAIAIDTEKDDDLLDNEDDDKAHGFKSLTMSRLVPRATRPISDRIDGIWVSAERLLMRQPTLRLGVIVYWVLLHALLASTI